MAGPLESIRVIDLATARAEMAGRLLADLGADVIKVEPPGGSPSRQLPPFENGSDPGPAGSLYWRSVALGKRSVTLDVGEAGDRARLLELATWSDILIESFDPGTLAGLGLGHEDLRRLNPALVYVSVTPWGQSGPLARDPASELTIEAAGGLMSLQGDEDRPPIPVGFPQAAFHAGVQAAADAIIALNERERSGLGQHLDVSMQAAIVWTLMNATGFPPNEGRDPPGAGDDRGQPRSPPIPGVQMRRLIRCRDGLLAVTLGLGRLGERTMTGLLDWMGSEGCLVPELTGVNWQGWAGRVRDGSLAADSVNAALDSLFDFLGRKTRAEVMREALKRELLLAPFNTVADLLQDRQLQARGYWRRVGPYLHAGAFARFSRTPIGPPRAAAELGEANGQRWAPRAPVPPAPETARRPAFDGVKVADFAWVGVGPLISKALADHGATVVHVESASRPDVLRAGPPFKDQVAGIDRSQFMANFNSSKLGLALNLATDGGKTLARRLISWADVVVESFTPGTMARMGLGWPEISRGRPDLVMLSTCLRGQTGPERSFSGFGNQGAALAGLAYITGWPDREPVGPWGAYTDFIAPRFGVAALAAALYHRRQTGFGQYVDLSQVEAAIHFMEPLVLQHLATGAVAGPVGHASERSCPHGVYRTKGTQRYVAIEVETVAQWQALRTVAPLAAFAGDGFEALTERQAAREPIDRALAAWCADQDPWDLARRLREVGVPAAVVQRPSDLYQDPQLAHRGFFVTLEHSVMGPTPYDGPVTQFSETPATLRKAAPALGEDTTHVLRDLLGLSEHEIADYAAAGVLN